jgi:hypothetical protein
MSHGRRAVKTFGPRPRAVVAERAAAGAHGVRGRAARCGRRAPAPRRGRADARGARRCERASADRGGARHVRPEAAGRHGGAGVTLRGFGGADATGARSECKMCLQSAMDIRACISAYNRRFRSTANISRALPTARAPRQRRAIRRAARRLPMRTPDNIACRLRDVC